MGLLEQRRRPESTCSACVLWHPSPKDIPFLVSCLEPRSGLSFDGQIVSTLAGEPAELKNGDVVLFGSDSQMRAHITPASNESTTVEQHLRAECEMLMQRVQVSTPPHFLTFSTCTAMPSSQEDG